MWVLKLYRHSLFLALFALIFSAYVAAPVSAQTAPPKDRTQLPPPDPILPDEERPETPDPDSLPEDLPDDTTDDDGVSDFIAPDILKQPDYSRMSSEAERRARLDKLFVRLANAANEDQGELIAEEIWALWLDSGSASVNFVLRRGAAAQTNGDMKLARAMYDHTLDLMPDYAEGWARSSRLALEEKNLSRALTEAAHALTLEPRHFYALWTMGNVFEQLGRNEEALEAYREANKLHPKLKSVEDRVNALRSSLEGDVL
ncbi:tetratricopeptide repeat protein [Litorimonas haliclonae]|uniref:tetratricopeptide repeat protein n=1 Tax=Litorimonas haliclonae TaxID=2081977 RepID=UPI0039F059B8